MSQVQKVSESRNMQGFFNRCERCGCYLDMGKISDNGVGYHSVGTCNIVDLAYVRRYRGILANDLIQLETTMSHWTKDKEALLNHETRGMFGLLARHLYRSSGQLPVDAHVPENWWHHEDTW